MNAHPVSRPVWSRRRFLASAPWAAAVAFSARRAPSDPRVWVYCDHNPHPGWSKERFTQQRWARDRRYKLYDDGRMFDLEQDPAEERPLPPGALPEVRARLQAVLDRYPPIPTRPDTPPPA